MYAFSFKLRSRLELGYEIIEIFQCLVSSLLTVFLQKEFFKFLFEAHPACVSFMFLDFC